MSQKKKKPTLEQRTESKSHPHDHRLLAHHLHKLSRRLRLHLLLRDGFHLQKDAHLRNHHFHSHRRLLRDSLRRPLLLGTPHRRHHNLPHYSLHLH